MIEWRTLLEVNLVPYRSRQGAAIQLRFEDSDHGSLCGYVHLASRTEYEQWVLRRGHPIPTRYVQRVSPAAEGSDGLPIVFHEAQVLFEHVS